MSTVRTGVVTIAHGRHDHLQAQHRSLLRGVRRPDRYVVVAMDDTDLTTTVHDGLRREVIHVDRDDDGLPLAAARNRGVAALADDVEVLVLLDVDCLAGEELVSGYADVVLAEPGTLWSGPVSYLPPTSGGYDLATLAAMDDPHPARPAPAPGEVERHGTHELFWSLSFALTPGLWGQVGGFDESYVGYGGEDTDFGLRARSAGVELAWVGAARAYHQHHPVSRPPVEHLDDILRNGRLFSRRWGHWPMRGWLEAMERQGLVRATDDGWERADPVG